MEEQREYDIDDLLRKYEKHLEEGTLSECVAESLAEKGVDAASFHAYDRQVKELAVTAQKKRCIRTEKPLIRPSVKNSIAPGALQVNAVQSGKTSVSSF